MRARHVGPVLLVLASLPASLRAQGESPRAGALAGVEFRTVTYGTGYASKSASELAAPLGVTLPISRRITLDVGTYFFHAERKDSSGASTSVSGLADVVLRGAFQLKPDVAVLTVAVSVPSGQGTLSSSQDSVARAVATDLIPFPVTNFGTGVNVTTGLAFAAPVGPWALGLAGSYRYNGSYEPFENNPVSLKPGGEVRFRVGADRIVGQGRVSLGLTFSSFSNDEFGSSARSAGSRIIPQASWSLPVGNNNLAFYAWDIYRNVSASVADTSIARNTLAGGAVLALRMGRNTLRPQVEFRHAWNWSSGSAGTLLGLGAHYSIAAGTRLTFVPGVRFDTGSLQHGTGTITFTGLSGSLTIRTSL